MSNMVYIHGKNGKMGLEIQKALMLNSFFESELTSCAEANYIVDFSTIEGNHKLLTELESHDPGSKSILIGTTGLGDDIKARWQALRDKGHSVMIAPNTSIGVLLAVKSAMQLVGVLEDLDFDVELIETHHRHKVDAPSGTAMFLAENIAKSSKNLQVCIARDGKRKPHELGVHALRGGGVFGEHEIRFMSETEELILSHKAYSRALFAKGALLLVKWLGKQNPGFYTLFDIELKDLH